MLRQALKQASAFSMSYRRKIIADSVSVKRGYIRRDMSFFSKLKEFTEEVQAELKKSDGAKKTTEITKDAKEEFEKRAQEQKRAFEEAIRNASTEASENEFVKEAKARFFNPLRGVKIKALENESKAKLLETFYEVFGMNKKKSLEETLTSSLAGKSTPKAKSDGEEEAAYTGTTAVVLVKGEQTAWERISARLKETPIIQSLLDAARVAAETKAGQAIGTGAKVAKNKIGDATEDVREYWETSQNPYVVCFINMKWLVIVFCSREVT
jgi:hypothetical protein